MANNDVTTQAASGAVTGAAMGGPWGAVAGAAAPVVGSLLGGLFGSDERSEADRLSQQALAEYLGISVPDIEKMKLDLDLYQSQGELTPELQALFEQGNSNLENVSIDPRYQQNQLAALESIAGFASGNLTPADLAGFELAKRDASSYDQAKQQQILSEMQQRGQGGSGAELIARLNSTQSSADRLQQAELEQARIQQQGRMQALQQQSNIAGQLRTQDYNEQSDLAQAQDAISRFNTQAKTNQNANNTNVANNAMQYNLGNKQRISESNVGLLNSEQQFNKGLYQKDFNNRMDLANSRSAALTGRATEKRRQAADEAGMYATIGQGAGAAIAGYNTYNNNQAIQNQNQKNDDRDYDLRRQQVLNETAQINAGYTPNYNNRRYNPNGF